jgi:hypothetical protein
LQERTPVDDAWILGDDEMAFRSQPGPVAPARLLPSGDAYYLLWGTDRGILVPEPKLRMTFSGHPSVADVAVPPGVPTIIYITHRTTLAFLASEWP